MVGSFTGGEAVRLYIAVVRVGSRGCASGLG